MSRAVGFILSAALTGFGGHIAVTAAGKDSHLPLPGRHHSARVSTAAVGPAQAYARAQLPRHHWGAEQWPCLRTLWTNESGWRSNADNPTSSAYGIPQALPGEKMSSAGKDWRTNPGTQIDWGLDYIAGRYGTPCRALTFWRAQSPHWY